MIHILVTVLVYMMFTMSNLKISVNILAVYIEIYINMSELIADHEHTYVTYIRTRRVLLCTIKQQWVSAQH